MSTLMPSSKKDEIIGYATAHGLAVDFHDLDFRKTADKQTAIDRIQEAQGTKPIVPTPAPATMLRGCARGPHP